MTKEVKPTTYSISDALSNSLPTQITSIRDSRQGTVSLYIQGRNLPLKLENDAHIVLGRRDSADDTFVTVDLTPADGRRLGVSRRHAVIHIDGDTITVEDLGSSNGTFLNDERIASGKPHPLHSGDKLRLGKLVIMFVYFFPQPRGKLLS